MRERNFQHKKLRESAGKVILRFKSMRSLLGLLGRSKTYSPNSYSLRLSLNTLAHLTVVTPTTSYNPIQYLYYHKNGNIDIQLYRKTMTQMFYPESQMERKKVDMSTLPKKNTFAFNLELVGAAWTVGTMHPWNLGTLAQKVGIKTQQAYAIRWQLKEAAQYLTQSRLNWENDKVWLSTVRLTEAAQPNDDTVASETDFQQVDYQKVGQYLAQGEYDILDDYLAGFGLSDFEKHEIMCEAVSYIHEYEDDQNGWA